MKAETLPEIITHQEVCEFFRVAPRTLEEYGLEPCTPGA